MGRVGGGEKACHDVGIYHLLIAARFRGFFFNRSDHLDLIEKDAVAVAFPGAHGIFNIMSFSPYAEVLCIHGILCLQILGNAFRILSFNHIFSVRIAIKNIAFGEIFGSGQFHLNIFKCGNCNIIRVTVYIHSFYTVDITEIILEIYRLPLGIAIVIPSNLIPGIDAGIVHLHIAVGLDAVGCCFRIGYASGGICGGNQSLKDVFVYGYGFCLDCGRRQISCSQGQSHEQ